MVKSFEATNKCTDNSIPSSQESDTSQRFASEIAETWSNCKPQGKSTSENRRFSTAEEADHLTFNSAYGVINDFVPQLQAIRAAEQVAERSSLGAAAGQKAGESVVTAAAQEALQSRNSDSAIPDVTRPQITDGKLLTDHDWFMIQENYEEDLGKLYYDLPREVTAEPGDTAASVAEKSLTARAPVTGERVTPEAIEKETERLQQLNPELKDLVDWSGKDVTLQTDDSLLQLAKDTQFKYVPQIGQYLKASGAVTEDEIQQALKEQKESNANAPGSQPPKKLGEILVEHGYATQAEVDAAFGEQTSLKDELSGQLDSFIRMDALYQQGWR